LVRERSNWVQIVQRTRLSGESPVRYRDKKINRFATSMKATGLQVASDGRGLLVIFAKGTDYFPAVTDLLKQGDSPRACRFDNCTAVALFAGSSDVSRVSAAGDRIRTCRRPIQIGCPSTCTFLPPVIRSSEGDAPPRVRMRCAVMPVICLRSAPSTGAERDRVGICRIVALMNKIISVRRKREGFCRAGAAGIIACAASRKVCAAQTCSPCC